MSNITEESKEFMRRNFGRLNVYRIDEEVLNKLGFIEPNIPEFTETIITFSNVFRKIDMNSLTHHSSNVIMDGIDLMKERKTEEYLICLVNSLYRAGYSHIAKFFLLLAPARVTISALHKIPAKMKEVFLSKGFVLGLNGEKWNPNNPNLAEFMYMFTKGTSDERPGNTVEISFEGSKKNLIMLRNIFPLLEARKCILTTLQNNRLRTIVMTGIEKVMGGIREVNLAPLNDETVISIIKSGNYSITDLYKIPEEYFDEMVKRVSYLRGNLCEESGVSPSFRNLWPFPLWPYLIRVDFAAFSSARVISPPIEEFRSFAINSSKESGAWNIREKSILEARNATEVRSFVYEDYVTLLMMRAYDYFANIMTLTRIFYKVNRECLPDMSVVFEIFYTKLFYCEEKSIGENYMRDVKSEIMKNYVRGDILQYSRIISRIKKGKGIILRDMKKSPLIQHTNSYGSAEVIFALSLIDIKESAIMRTFVSVIVGDKVDDFHLTSLVLMFIFLGIPFHNFINQFTPSPNTLSTISRKNIIDDKKIVRSVQHFPPMWVFSIDIRYMVVNMSDPVCYERIVQYGLFIIVNSEITRWAMSNKIMCILYFEAFYEIKMKHRIIKYPSPSVIAEIILLINGSIRTAGVDNPDLFVMSAVLDMEEHIGKEYDELPYLNRAYRCLRAQGLTIRKLLVGIAIGGVAELEENIMIREIISINSDFTKHLSIKRLCPIHNPP